jgi:hypothetical protein
MTSFVTSRRLLGGVAALFSLFHIALGVYSINVVAHPAPVIAAMVVYGLATGLSLAPIRPRRMPIWLAALNCGVVVVMVLLVSTQLDPQREGGNGFATWYVAAAGTLLTITATRGRYGFAWAGSAFLVLHTIAWSGWPAVVSLGVVGSVAWVAIAQMIGRGMAKATRDARRFALAEQEAADWQALQEAHVHERQFRLGQTNSMALAMLRVIEESGGELTEAQRRECLLLESSIRDEIRGRVLLNDAVRRAVMAARRRGAVVTLLDEGGLDELSQSKLDRVLDRVADALHQSRGDRMIVRTVIDGPTAVTVVGLRSADGATNDRGGAGALGDDSDDDEIELWLEIPRP